VSLASAVMSVVLISVPFLGLGWVGLG